MKGKTGRAILCAVCAVALLGGAFYAGARVSGGSLRIRERLARLFGAAPEAVQEQQAESVKYALYGEDNVPYAFVPGRDEPSLPDEAAVDEVVELQVEMAREAHSGEFDEAKWRARFREQIDIADESYAPSLRAYLVEGSPIGVVVFPGGGYHMLSSTIEGSEIAEAFNARGISAFVVKYRIAPCDYRAILADGQRAIRYVRYHADDFGLSPDGIVACGFSQGGHLALMTCQHPEYAVEDTQYVPDAVDAVSSVPNACIVGYGVATLEKGHTFEVGAQIFTHGDDSLRAVYSAENDVDADMCPTFIWLNRDDKLVPVEGAYRLAEACAAQGVPYEFHAFVAGGHGCGLGQGLPCGEWMSLACKWLDRTIL